MNVRLKQVRESLGITQSMVEKKLGISIQRLSNYENGHREPNFDTLVSLADYYGVSVDYLIGRDAEPYRLPEKLDFSRFGGRIEEFRERRGMTREEVAARLGVSAGVIAAIEKGEEIPRMDFCVRLLNALDLAPDAAFMDLSTNGSLVRPNYIRDRAQSLGPYENELFLGYLEKILKLLEGHGKEG